MPTSDEMPRRQVADHARNQARQEGGAEMTGDEGMDGIWKELVGAWADLDHARHELMEAMDHAEKAAAELSELAILMDGGDADGDGDDGDGDD